MRSSWDPKTPSLLPAIICYADILGFRNMTEDAFKSRKSCEAEEFLRRIKRSLDAAYKKVREAQTLRGKIPPIFDMKVFTDNIIIAYPLPDPNIDDGEFEIGTVLMLFAEVQAGLAEDGFFLRGAITKGPHYQDQDIVYGNAFLNAVKQDKSGEPPRLVIGPSVECMILKHLASYGYHEAPHHDSLLEDTSDGRLFVSYLNVAFECFPDEPINHELLAAHSKEVRKGLQKHKNDERVLPKYMWLAAYHNYVCRAFAEKYAIDGGEDYDF